jgi:hypothetical protein
MHEFMATKHFHQNSSHPSDLLLWLPIFSKANNRANRFFRAL